MENVSNGYTNWSLGVIAFLILYEVAKGATKNGKKTGKIADGQWRLYNIANDPGETEGLSAAMPDLYSVMLDQYRQYAQINNVLDMSEGTITSDKALSTASIPACQICTCTAALLAG
jgi:hypothetical protein